ncbi:MAG TPA: DUF2569 domain-containing protein, partial [Opitutaceae bacterium]
VSPYSLPFPLKFSVHTIVDLPSHWPLIKKDLTVIDKGFTASSTSHSVGNEMTFDYTYETKDDSVAPDRMAEYASHLSEFRKEVGATLTYNTEIAEQNKKFRLNKVYVFSGVGALLILGFTAGYIYTRNWGLHPIPQTIDSHLSGISGWLVLVMIGVCLRPAVDIWAARVVLPFFDFRRWVVLVPEAHSLFLGLLFLRIFGIVAALLTAVTFFKRRRLFPLVFLFNIAHDYVFAIFNAYVHTRLSAQPTDFAITLGKSVGALILPSLIWISYMFLSRRVKSTFIRDYRVGYSDSLTANGPKAVADDQINESILS